MKVSTSALQTYLTANDTVVICDLYTFSLVGIGLLRYIDYPFSVVVFPKTSFPDPNSLNHGTSGFVQFNRGPRFGRSKVSTKIGIEPAEVDIECFPASVSTAEAEDTIGNLSWQQFALGGGFDGAIVEIDRFFFPAQGSTLGSGDGFTGAFNFTLGSVIWFYGKMANVDIQRSKITFKVKALINVLQQQQMPRRIFQSGCTHIFGDAMCKYNRVLGENAAGSPTGAGAVNFSATSGSNQTVLIPPSSPAGFYTQGSVTGLNGANNGITRMIMNVSGGIIYLSKPLPFAVTIGDGFQALPGCDHTSSTCQNTFNNLSNFGGFPYIPPPEISV